jgi:hypothetical protein
MTSFIDRIVGRRPFALALLILVAGVLLYNALFSFSYSIGPNYRNVSIDTRVNITHARPEVLNISCDKSITLNAGTTKTVTCNATIRVWSGPAEIADVYAVFWDNNTANYTSPDRNNNHYTNASCTQNVSYALYYVNYTCNFSIWYYANNGTNWLGNITAYSNYSFNSSVGNWSSNYTNTTINALLALNVTPLIDYGNMAVGDTSGPQTANVTNFGNLNMNVSVRGYGATQGDGLAFVCQIGNISIANEKYSLNQSGDFLIDYHSLSSVFTQIPSLTMPQQTNDTQQVINSTYWRLYVPPNPFGQCNGTIVFQAETP